MLKSGMMIGNRYEIINKIGSGGMSTVYKGKDVKLNRNVAIKVLKSEYRDDRNFIRKFREEAQAAACLAHPNIVNVYDVGEENGIYYIVMELVEGITLKNYIDRKGKLTIKEATSIAIQVSMGLEVAHNNDIVHRDIKPQNIMISKDGKVKVMDFGIAKAATSDTIASNAMGSVHYTSPEQARGGYSDIKSDIYSLGIVMFEMVTGRVPFDGETTVAVAVKHLQDELPSPRMFCPELPISLESIIYKCTEKVSAKRYANMSELIADLKQSLQTPDIDFVKKVNVDEAAKTVMITKNDIAKIKNETGRIHLPEESFSQNEDEDDGYDNYDDYDDDDDDDYHSERNYHDDDDDDDGYDDDDDYDDEDDDDEIDPRMEKLMTYGGIAAAVIIVIMIVMVAGKILGFGKGGSDSKKPQQQTEQEEQDVLKMIDVRGKTWEEAKEALNKIGLGITSGGTEETDEYEEGQVMKQSVAAGKEVERNTTIEVVLAAKKEDLVKVPDLKDESKEDAVYRLEQEGFIVELNEVHDEAVKAGRVIKISPSAGTEVAKGSAVVITISKGPEVKTTTVPDLKGKTKKEAEEAIKDAKLNVGNASEEYDDKVEKGKVISQTPSAGKEREEGTTVDFVISKGSKKVKIPNLYGNPEARAKEKLTALGLKMEVVYENSNEVEGRVFDFTPAEGTEVDPGSTVKVVISKGKAPVKKTYAFSTTLEAPDDMAEDGRFKVVLKTADGNEITSGECGAGESVAISVSGQTINSATLVQTYQKADGSNYIHEAVVTFTEE